METGSEVNGMKAGGEKEVNGESSGYNSENEENTDPSIFSACDKVNCHDQSIIK